MVMRFATARPLVAALQVARVAANVTSTILVSAVTVRCKSVAGGRVVARFVLPCPVRRNPTVVMRFATARPLVAALQDYKSPPPAGKFDGLYRSAQNSMKRDAVRLNLPQRQRAVEEIVGSFAKWQIELKILAVTEIHLHALARVPDHNPRHDMGLAKKECSA